VGGGGEGCVVACLLFCHALFLGGFHWFSLACAPWSRGVCRVAGGFVVCVGVFGLGFRRGVVVLCLGVLGRVLGHGVFGRGIWRARVVFGGFLGQIPILCVCCADLACVLVWVLG
jgi:hypothetical protein